MSAGVEEEAQAATWQDEVVYAESDSVYTAAIHVHQLAGLRVVENHWLPADAPMFFDEAADTIYVREVDDLLWRFYLADQRGRAERHLARTVERVRRELGLSGG